MPNFIKQVYDTKRLVIITQHGKGVAVLLAVNEFEAMQEKIEHQKSPITLPKINHQRQKSGFINYFPWFCKTLFPANVPYRIQAAIHLL